MTSALASFNPGAWKDVSWGTVSSAAIDSHNTVTEKLRPSADENQITTANLPVSSVRDAVVFLQKPGSGEGRELSVEELKELMAEVVAAYSDPELQRNIDNIIRRAQKCTEKSETEDLMTGLKEILWPCQTNIIESFGMPGSVEGLQRVQNSVQRRITEGDVELRVLSDEALMLIRMNPLRNVIQEVNAEDFLSIIYDVAGDASPLDVEQFFRDLKCDNAWERAARARGVSAAAKLVAERKPKGGLSFGLLRTWAAMERLGMHPNQIIHHPEPPPVVRLKRPTPAQVWEFVIKNQPVIIEDGIDGKEFPPLLDFPDFEYLTERCGHRYVKVKGDSCWDAKGRQLFLNDPTIEIPVAEYLSLIETAEAHETCISWYMGKVPLREEMPELWEDILNAPKSPLKKFGSCFGPNDKGSYTYFGCGGNTTCLHTDPSENLMCVVSGEKWLDIFPPWQADCLHTTVKKCLNSLVPPFCDPKNPPADVDAHYPNYKHATPLSVHLKAGDLFYLPIFWWHAVQGSIGRNMILNWWCQMHPDKEHYWGDLEGTEELLEVTRQIQESWNEKDKKDIPAATQKVVGELCTEILMLGRRCDQNRAKQEKLASKGFGKGVTDHSIAKPPTNGYSDNNSTVHSNSLYPGQNQAKPRENYHRENQPTTSSTYRWKKG